MMEEQNVSINGVGECHTSPHKGKLKGQNKKIQNYLSIAVHYGIRFIDSVKARKTILYSIIPIYAGDKKRIFDII